MKRTPVFYLKTTLAVLGAILLLLSGFMPIIEKSVLGFSMSNQISMPPIGEIKGFNSPLWYLILLAALVIFAIGYFSNKTVNRTLVFVFIPVFTVGILFFTFVFTFSLALDPGEEILSIGKGYFVTICGALLVILATCISVMKKKSTENPSTDLLDS